jgi:hypothetical protein
MKTIHSGSNPGEHDSMIGTLTFMESGVVDIFVSKDEDIDELIVSTFHMTSDFIFYALSRTDWMTEFASNYIVSDGVSGAPDASPTLTVLKGGKED